MGPDPPGTLLIRSDTVHRGLTPSPTCEARTLPGPACFYCGEVLCDWQPDDVPRAEHRREMPRCHFARCGAWLSRHLGPGQGGCALRPGRWESPE